MITDIGLRLATAEAPCNGGTYPSGLGGDSVALALDLAGITTLFTSGSDIGGGEGLALAFNVDTDFESDTVLTTIEYQLVSIPILATLLTNGSGGAGNGKLLSTLVSTVVASETFTLAAHGFPLGAPVYIGSLGATTTGPTLNVVHYVIPVTANTFMLAETLALARLGTGTLLGGTNAVADVEVSLIPTIHGSTGSLPVYQNDTQDVTPLTAGSRFMVPLHSLQGLTAQQALPTGQTLTQPEGVGPAGAVASAGLSIATTAQRYFYLRSIISSTDLDPVGSVVDAGAVTCDLVLASSVGNPLSYSPTMTEVIG